MNVISISVLSEQRVQDVIFHDYLATEVLASFRHIDPVKSGLGLAPWIQTGRVGHIRWREVVTWGKRGEGVLRNNQPASPLQEGQRLELSVETNTTTVTLRGLEATEFHRKGGEGGGVC